MGRRMQEGCRFLLVLKLRSSCGVEIEENMEEFPLVVEIKGEEGRRGSYPPCGVEIEGNTGREVASLYSLRRLHTSTKITQYYLNSFCHEWRSIPRNPWLERL